MNEVAKRPGDQVATGHLIARARELAASGLTPAVAEDDGTPKPLVIPSSRADLEAVLAAKPQYWEYLLFCGELSIGLDECSPQYSALKAGVVEKNADRVPGAEGIMTVLNQMQTFTTQIAPIGTVMTPANMSAVFSPPNPDRIREVGQTIVSVYRNLLAGISSTQALSLDVSLDGLQAVAVRMYSLGIDAIRKFVNDFHDSLRGLPVLLATRKETDPPLRFNIMLNLPQDQVSVLMAEAETEATRAMLVLR
jgi:hypothetical protein